MKEKTPYLSFSPRKPRAASLLIKAAAEKNTEIMRYKTVYEHRETITKLAEVRPVLPGIQATPTTCNGVNCEWVYKNGAKDDRVIMYIHGGSWMHGNLKTAQAPAILLAEATDCRVFVVDYRLSPEHPFPAGLSDCLTVFNWLTQCGYNARNIALLGDSAGGNLSLALLHSLKAQGRELPRAVALASPVPDIRLSSEIIKSRDNLIYTQYEGKEADIFSLYARENDRENPLLSPVCGDVTGFCPLLIHVGGDEPLSLDCLAFAKKAYAGGVPVSLKIFRGMFHDFSIVGLALKESRDSIKEFAEFFKQQFEQ